jgi:S1-C subfamily serine protease
MLMCDSSLHRLFVAASGVAALAFLAQPPAQARAPLFDETRGVLTMAPMLEQVTPAVVNIAVIARVVEDNPLLKDPFFRRFFGIPENAPAQQDRRALAAGSGVIIDGAKGFVVTNHHVIKNAEIIAVTLKDGRQLKAELVGSDPGTEVALLRIPAGGLTSVPFGDSEGLKVGDVVLAIGNPFGVGQTVTSGIVSALGRSGLTADNYEDFIQTDAPINPGNSGGALVNSKGELIGINTAIIAPTGGNVGIGFAVPANMVQHGEGRGQSAGALWPGATRADWRCRAVSNPRYCCRQWPRPGKGRHHRLAGEGLASGTSWAQGR